MITYCVSSRLAYADRWRTLATGFVVPPLGCLVAVALLLTGCVLEACRRRHSHAVCLLLDVNTVKHIWFYHWFSQTLCFTIQKLIKSMISLLSITFRQSLLLAGCVLEKGAHHSLSSRLLVFERPNSKTHMIWTLILSNTVFYQSELLWNDTFQKHLFFQ